jgi:hypothetical protein
VDRPATPGAAAPAVPPALRAQRRAGWRDPRIVVGAALVIVASTLGAWGWSASQRTVQVWAVSTDLASGSRLEDGDLELKVVAPSAAGAYLSVERAPWGRTLGRDVGAGELLAASALAEDADVERRAVTVPVEASRAPMGLQRGARVDVYVTPRSDAGRQGSTALVLADAAVGEVDAGDTRFSAAGRTWSVVLLVPTDRVPQLVAGARRGDVDLVERAR